jgi:hypothetical protein
LEFEVTDADSQRINKVKLRPLEEKADNESSAETA